jgi:hypothetical protein
MQVSTAPLAPAEVALPSFPSQQCVGVTHDLLLQKMVIVQQIPFAENEKNVSMWEQESEQKIYRSTEQVLPVMKIRRNHCQVAHLTCYDAIECLPSAIFFFEIVLWNRNEQPTDFRASYM